MESCSPPWRSRPTAPGEMYSTHKDRVQRVRGGGCGAGRWMEACTRRGENFSPCVVPMPRSILPTNARHRVEMRPSLASKRDEPDATARPAEIGALRGYTGNPRHAVRRGSLRRLPILASGTGGGRGAGTLPTPAAVATPAAAAVALAVAAAVATIVPPRVAPASQPATPRAGVASATLQAAALAVGAPAPAPPPVAPHTEQTIAAIAIRAVRARAALSPLPFPTR